MAATQLALSAARCTTNPTLSCARTALVHALAEERLCKRRSDAASVQLYGGGAPLPAALLEPPSSQILRADGSSHQHSPWVVSGRV